MKFEKGKTGNAGGRPKLTEREKTVQTLTKETFNDLCEKMMTCTKDDMEDMLGGKLPYEAELFIRHMLSLGESTDWNQYDKYLNRRIGKVMEPVEVTINHNLADRMAKARARIGKK